MVTKTKVGIWYFYLYLYNECDTSAVKFISHLISYLEFGTTIHIMVELSCCVSYVRVMENWRRDGR